MAPTVSITADVVHSRATAGRGSPPPPLGAGLPCRTSTAHGSVCDSTVLRKHPGVARCRARAMGPGTLLS